MERYTDNLKLTDFIMAWKYDHKIVDDLVEYFMKNKHLWHDGIAGGRVQKEVKESLDCTVPRRFDHPFKNYYECLQKSFDEYLSEYPQCKELGPIRLIETVNFQFYKPGNGFKAWHTERVGDDDKGSRRVFVFMTYLNDVPNGGTDFYYQQLTIPAKKGLTIIWPAEWTHTHRGQITNEHEKMIFTGWFSFPKFKEGETR
tara:strand:+ start:467 stop:1066 length:600 start_codon:yes stop_codon:yes gene_type:complete